jgi:hypothetical protein
MRQVRSDDERPTEEDTLGLSASDLVQLPVLVRISRIPVESHTTRKFIWESLHGLYITPIYARGKLHSGFAEGLRDRSQDKIASTRGSNAIPRNHVPCAATPADVQPKARYRLVARQSRSARCRLLFVAASAGNFL